MSFSSVNKFTAETRMKGGFSDLKGRLAIVLRGNIAAQRVGPQEAGYRWVEIDGIRIYNVYWPPSSSSSTDKFKDLLTRLEDSICESDLPVIAVGNFNSKSGSWCSLVEDARGILLADLMASIDKMACNQGNSSTFVRNSSETYIDITFAKNQIIGRISGWKVLGKESLSFHRYITFEIRSNQAWHMGQKADNWWCWRKFCPEKLR